ncbi:MAG TPA: hypothetical protein VK306_07260 [Acidimicrobiales bacterium]|jgi:hypothetical protein|nr:hypothetical protein [Acidimicrobiales bacterium]
MSACQLVFLEHSADRVLLDLVPLEPIEVNSAVVPQGMPLTVTFLPNDDDDAHDEMVALFDRWLDDDGMLDVGIEVAADIGGLRYVFTRDDEQLVLDVQV